VSDGDEETTSTNTTSGISNFTYVKSPFNIEAGIKVLQEICRCEKLAVLTNVGFSTIGLSEDDIYADSEPELEWLPLGENLSNSVSAISDDLRGVYVLSPLADYSPNEIRKLLFRVQMT